MLGVFPLADKPLQLITAADPAKKHRQSYEQIRTLARDLGLYTSSEDLDIIADQWTDHLLEEDVDAGNSQAAKYWCDAVTKYPELTSVMQALLCVPHSNASLERVFSMLKKVLNDQRSDLSTQSVNVLLRLKMKSDGCCKDVKFAAELIKSAKKAINQYNMSHTFAAQPGQSTTVVNWTVVIYNSCGHAKVLA